ncbi:F-box only protein 6-like isoform X2 [Neodiprion virginianus]|uniref:F-box only protein 6-like isoform X2 n=1 Tax=Neodiprion virginianus TaxID=2961670 RepID=UPI001EE73CDE|nr:F-box only protein 6-like isoform X2 [Neodiprion virginianus]
MGQLQSMMYETRVKFDENSDNGLVLTDRYLPEELLSEILFHVDHKTLLNCQLVCKRWQLVLQNYVWRKKAEAVIGQHLDINEETSWLLYYNICSKKFLEKNLIKNHSGKNGPRKHWKQATNHRFDCRGSATTTTRNISTANCGQRVVLLQRRLPSCI